MEDNYLMHYGIKGMKWGVRRAIQKGDSKRFARNYKRARKKLDRLEQKASMADQKAESRKYAKRALIGAGIGTAGVGIGSRNLVKTFIKGRHAANAVAEGVKELAKGINAPGVKPITIKEITIKENTIPETVLKENTITSQSSLPSASSKSVGRGARSKLRQATTVAGLGALGYAGYAGGRSLAAKYRITKKGHAKAVAKRNAFKKEMDYVFNQPGTRKLKRKSK